ncbi:hypothetical protein D3C78_1239050 [compost metagenome]
MKRIADSLLVDIGNGRLPLARLQQRQPLEGDGAVVGTVDREAALDKLQRLHRVAAHHGDAGQAEEARIPAVATPSRLVEVVEGGVQQALALLDMGAQQAGLAALGVLVEAVGPGQRLVGIRQRLLIVGAVVFQRRQRQVAAIVAPVQRQRPQVVVKGGAAGVQVLLQVLADEVELIDRVEIRRGQGRRGRIRQGLAGRLML